MFSEDGQKQQN